MLGFILAFGPRTLVGRFLMYCEALRRLLRAEPCEFLRNPGSSRSYFCRLIVVSFIFFKGGFLEDVAATGLPAATLFSVNLIAC